MAKAGYYYSPLKHNDDRALCFTYDDDDLINNDEQSIISDKNENLEIECDDNNDLNDEYQKKEQHSNKILKRICFFLICFKSGYLILYDAYRTTSLDNNQEDNNIDILTNR
ncbi:unnamed protein product [Rotaria magnacalcarata]|uniref:Uncharacterized protein n=1 Tax=Rotaria magnacalcarata TaxID=392030 RepID=A0A814L346_9BILA|nr:unnamed protein product [Rotaria magnacalcarata]CAF3775071.1 unnamed protein product [Rotaria magnacalcarata]CAF3825861.1 unnamed protein product [Rotaria magnacalcarata]CAF3861699.1 unnamed protein product [Rotaria magnacalcarata]CAF4046919.1 unnamed protein product [Rotaria magnacalcarata]